MASLCMRGMFILEARHFAPSLSSPSAHPHKKKLHSFGEVSARSKSLQGSGRPSATRPSEGPEGRLPKREMKSRVSLLLFVFFFFFAESDDFLGF